MRPGQTGLCFRDVAELETVLERALAEPDLRASIVVRAARQVASDRLERRHAGDRLGFYLSAATQLGFRLAPRQPFDWGVLLEDRYRPRTFADSRYVALGAGKLVFGDGMHQTDGATLFCLTQDRGESVWQLVRGRGFHFTSLIAVVVFMLLGFSAITAVFWATIAAAALSFLRRVQDRDLLLGAAK